MINLLPPEVKEMRSYGRRNVLLVRWSLICLGAALLLVGIAGAGYFFITNAEKAAAEAKQQTEKAIETAKLDEVSKQFDAFSGNLKTVTQILSKQVLFSQLIRQIGSVTPAGATLNSVSLSDADNALNLDFKVPTSDLAATIQVNLEDEKNGLFEKADIIQVSCITDANKQQSCTVSVRALYRKDANFLFLNSVTSKAATP